MIAMTSINNGKSLEMNKYNDLIFPHLCSLFLLAKIMYINLYYFEAEYECTVGRSLVLHHKIRLYVLYKSSKRNH